MKDGQPRESSFMGYLPESYQDEPGSFWERFISIFQTLYTGVDDQIAAYPAQLDPLTAEDEALRRLADWLGFSAYGGFGATVLRRLVGNAGELLRIWGTKGCMERLFTLSCGQKPYIMEHFRRGGDPLGFSVLLHKDGFTAAHRGLLLELMESAKPAHANGELVLLEDGCALDAHSYLGVNSRICGYATLRMDGQTVLGLHHLQKGDDHEPAL